MGYQRAARAGEITVLKYIDGTAPLLVINPLMVYGSKNTTAGVVTINLTDDGTATGSALFDDKPIVIATAAMNTVTAINISMPCTKLLSSDFKTLTINVVQGANTGLLGGNSLQFAGSGVEVDFQILGK